MMREWKAFKRSANVRQLLTVGDISWRGKNFWVFKCINCKEEYKSHCFCVPSNSFKITGCQGLGGERGWRGREQRVCRAVILYWWIHVSTSLSKPTECTAPRMNPNINYRLWVIMLCQCSLINCGKHATLVRGVLIMGEAMRVWG